MSGSIVAQELEVLGQFIKSLGDGGRTDAGYDGEINIYWDAAASVVRMQVYSSTKGGWEAFDPTAYPHASRHSVAAGDTITIENLATAGAIGTAAVSDGAGAVAMTDVTTGAELTSHAGAPTAHHSNANDHAQAHTVPSHDGTPGGELGGTWTTPTVNPSHGGGSHAATQAAAEATAAADTDADIVTHTAIAAAHHAKYTDAEAIAAVPTAWDVVGEGAVPTAGSTIFDVSAISTAYDVFHIIIHLNDPSVSSNCILRLNNDSGTNYWWNTMYLNAATATTYTNANGGVAPSSIAVAPAGVGTNAGTSMHIDIMLTKDSTGHHARCTYNWAGFSSATQNHVGHGGGGWSNTTAKIDRIAVTGPTVSGGSYTVLGRKIA